MDDLDIVYCKDCKYFVKESINENSDVMYCRKKNNIENNPNIYINKQCYKKKEDDNKKKKKERKWKKH